MFSHAPLVDSRRAAYARLASRVLECLNEAVELRQSNGATRSQIAEKLGYHRSQLSRILNGTTPNLTLRTISDVLWATDCEPTDFTADPIEQLSQNCPTFAAIDGEYESLWTTTHSYPVHRIGMDGWGNGETISTELRVGVDA